MEKEITQQNIETPLETFKAVLRFAFGLAFVITICVVLFWIVAPDRCWYPFWYGVPKDAVFVEDKPTDCDFMRAPIGDKACSYHKNVYVNRNEQDKATAVYVTWEKQKK